MDKSTQIQTKGKTRQTKGVFFFFFGVIIPTWSTRQEHPHVKH